MKGTMMLKRDVAVLLGCIFVLILLAGAAGNRGRQHAKDIICRANLKGIGQASLEYTRDNDGQFFSYQTSPTYSLWINHLRDYTGGLDRIRICPMTKKIENPNMTFTDGYGTATEAWFWKYGSIAAQAHGSYGFNGWLSADPRWQATHERFGNLSNIGQPELTPIFSDAAYVDIKPKHTVGLSANHDLETCRPDVHYGMNRLVMNRHGSYVNIGFVDGHVGPVELKMLWNLKWNAVFELQGEMTRVDGSPIYQEP